MLTLLFASNTELADWLEHPAMMSAGGLLGGAALLAYGIKMFHHGKTTFKNGQRPEALRIQMHGIMMTGVGSMALMFGVGMLYEALTR